MTRHSKKNVNLDRQSQYMILVCLAILATAFLLTVTRDLRTRRPLEIQVSEASQLVKRHQLLTPLMNELLLNDVEPILESESFPSLLPIPDASSENYEKIIGQLLLECSLKQTVLIPDIQSVLSDKDYILVDMATRGAFSNFRDLLLKIGTLPFVSGIERFRVQRLTGAEGLELFLQLRIQVASSVDGANENQ